MEAATKLKIATSPSAPRNDSGVPGSFASFRITEALLQDDSVKELLDVISSIIADEYIQVARKNRETFTEIASASPRNDGTEGLK